MNNPTVLIHNIETDEIIVREMNAEELVQFDKDGIEFDREKAAIREAEAAKAQAEAKLAALGLTADDLRALGL